MSFLVSVFISTHKHIPIKYRCLNYCFVISRHVYLKCFEVFIRSIQILMGKSFTFAHLVLQRNDENIQISPWRSCKPKSTQGRLGFMGVTGLFFMLLEFSYLDFHNETCVALANLQWSTDMYQSEDGTFPELDMHNHNCTKNRKCMFIDS